MLKNLSLACVLGISLVQAAFAEDGGVDVFIELTGLAGLEGNVYFAVYDSKDSWLGDETVHEHNVSIVESLDGEIVKTHFTIAPGDYAISIYYDENGNGELDTNFIGIPKEPVAISNNARPRFGPPKYKDAVFTVADEPVTQQITIEAI